MDCPVSELEESLTNLKLDLEVAGDGHTSIRNGRDQISPEVHSDRDAGRHDALGVEVSAWSDGGACAPASSTQGLKLRLDSVRHLDGTQQQLERVPSAVHCSQQNNAAAQAVLLEGAT